MYSFSYVLLTLKKGQVYEGSVVRVDFPNKGIVCVGDETAVVKNSLPGQKVKFSVNKVRKGKAEGRLLEVTEKSPLETGRTCSLFGLCGGCTYLSLPYEEQLKVKEEQVKRLLDSVLNKQEEAWAFEGIKGSPKAYEYRNKMEFSFGDEYKDGPLALGMHKRGSFYDIVTVADCEIVDADYRLILQTVRDYFARAKVSFFHRMSHEGYLRHLLVRKASRTGEILVALVTTSQDPWQGETAVEGSLDVDALITGFKDLLLSLEQDRKLAGKFAGILHITNDSIADVVQSDRTGAVIRTGFTQPAFHYYNREAFHSLTAGTDTYRTCTGIIFILYIKKSQINYLIFNILWNINISSAY